MHIFGPALLIFAQIATPADIPKKPLYTATGEKVICRLTVQPGSRIPIRICRTEADWERISRENQEDLMSSRNTASRGVACMSIYNC
jgi:hypothetical protein